MTVYEPDPVPIHKRRLKLEFLISAIKTLEFCHVKENKAKKVFSTYNLLVNFRNKLRFDAENPKVNNLIQPEI